MKQPFSSIIARVTFLAVVFLLAHTLHASEASQESAIEPGSTELITIFVHGIIGARYSLSFYHLFKLVRDATYNTVYEKTIDGIRNDPFFFENQPIDHVGLKKLDISELKKGNAALLAAYLYEAVDANVFQPAGNQAEIKHSYYTYGWSGLLSKKAREADAQKFFAALEELSKEAQLNNQNLKIRLIGFSHGGNICAQLVQAKQKLNPESSLTIDELLLVGTPILEETKLVLSDPLFSHVYNMYSPADHIQKKEIFSGELFSSQKFKPSKDSPLPMKLTQIELRVQKDRTKKNRYTKKVKNFGASDYSPGHMELWFFGWTPRYYRKDYPFYPLPTIVFAPQILKSIEDVKNNQKPIVVTLQPERNKIRIGKTDQEFLKPEMLDELKKVALANAPEAYSLTQYRKHLKQAYWQAREERAPLPTRR